MSLPAEGRRRVVIEQVTPGPVPAKCVVGDPFVVECDAFADGHDAITVVLRWRRAGSKAWSEAEMTPLDNDRFRGTFVPDALGGWEYSVTGWVDKYGSWRSALQRRIEVTE